MRALSRPGKIYLCYDEFAGDLMIDDQRVPLHYRVFDPRSGELVSQGMRETTQIGVSDPGGAPRVYILQRD